jgi:hypothetical protein
MKFFRELKRRRVLNTAWLYVVGGWLALQVVEVLSAAGLPPSTMRNLLIFLLLGFPVAVVVGWFYDITKEGISRTGRLKEGETLPKLGFTDHILLAGLVLVIAMDAYILSFPSPQEPVVQPSVAQRAGRRVATVSHPHGRLTRAGAGNQQGAEPGRSEPGHPGKGTCGDGDAGRKDQFSR